MARVDSTTNLVGGILLRKPMLVLLILILTCSNPAMVRAENVSCLDADGKTVDWWLIYKFPKLSNKESKNGLGYAYADPNRHLEVAKNTLLEPSSLSVTLEQMYSNTCAGYLMWNDTPWGMLPSSSRAHSKGVMIFDQSQGCLIRHSVPQFPVKRDQYRQWFFSNRIYGQTLLCMSVSLDTLDQIALQYTISKPYVYDSYVPHEISLVYKNLAYLKDGVRVDKRPSNAIKFVTIGSQGMIDFAKSRRCSCDLWEDVISSELKEGMNVLSWGRPLELSACPPKEKYPVQNVRSIRWGNGLFYAEEQEHSKWGLTISTNILCIGDINRMVSQRNRGGGATCFRHASLADAFKNLIASIEACKNTD
ncbi:plancitoxin-1-like [Schistocerca gregaria]|uniref:plancitoxin-1-like n=1 Tax=Schistocerca gregaria TaxID=7010 RepID=UPI00211DE272|nr:plancitoxin-1-like [Schistocerca gregaria]